MLDPQVGWSHRLDALGVGDHQAGAGLTARRKRTATRGWLAEASAPTIKMQPPHRNPGRSSTSPRSIDTSNGSTEGEWQSRVQWFAVVGFSPTRQNFCTTYPSSLVAFALRARQNFPMAGEAIGRRLEGLVPAHGDQAPTALDHRTGDAIARVDEPRAEAALDAQHAEARAVCRDVIGHDRQSRVGADGDGDATADAAVGTRRLHDPLDLRGRFLRAKGAGRTRGHALTARGAHRRGHRAVAEHADLHRMAPPQQRDRADLLVVVAGHRAAAAEDAGVAVQHEKDLVASVS